MLIYVCFHQKDPILIDIEKDILYRDFLQILIGKKLISNEGYVSIHYGRLLINKRPFLDLNEYDCIILEKRNVFSNDFPSLFIEEEEEEEEFGDPAFDDVIGDFLDDLVMDLNIDIENEDFWGLSTEIARINEMVNENSSAIVPICQHDAENPVFPGISVGNVFSRVCSIIDIEPLEFQNEEQAILESFPISQQSIIKKICEMGFNQESAIATLIKNDFDESKAIHDLHEQNEID